MTDMYRPYRKGGNVRHSVKQLNCPHNYTKCVRIYVTTQHNRLKHQLRTWQQNPMHLVLTTEKDTPLITTPSHFTRIQTQKTKFLTVILRFWSSSGSLLQQKTKCLTVILRFWSSSGSLLKQKTKFLTVILRFQSSSGSLLQQKTKCLTVILRFWSSSGSLLQQKFVGIKLPHSILCKFQNILKNHDVGSYVALRGRAGGSNPKSLTHNTLIAHNILQRSGFRFSVYKEWIKQSNTTMMSPGHIARKLTFQPTTPPDLRNPATPAAPRDPCSSPDNIRLPDIIYV